MPGIIRSCVQCFPMNWTVRRLAQHRLQLGKIWRWPELWREDANGDPAHKAFLESGVILVNWIYWIKYVGYLNHLTLYVHGFVGIVSNLRRTWAYCFAHCASTNCSLAVICFLVCSCMRLFFYLPSFLSFFLALLLSFLPSCMRALFLWFVFVEESPVLFDFVACVCKYVCFDACCKLRHRSFWDCPSL